MPQLCSSQHPPESRRTTTKKQTINTMVEHTVYQGRRRRFGWSGLSRTNNLELNQLADQLVLHYSHAIFGRSHLHVATDILQVLLKIHDKRVVT